MPLMLGAASLGAGASLHWHVWMPQTPPRAVILLAHGYAEHLGRYDHVAAHLNAQGFAVYALDHWGHGRSDGTPGFVPKFSVFTDGVELLLAKIEAAHPDLPRFLIGHSTIKAQ
jgi:alpha-beta hydrolase superfamily lysophospholipase